MSLANNIFGRNLQELTMKDVESFFSTEQEETSVLEFKSGASEHADHLYNKVYREVTAFLNTNGGILILGAPMKQNNSNGKEVYQGSLIPVTCIKSKDILVQKLASNITPSPVGINVKELVKNDGKIFIVEVEKSLHPPHQNMKDCVYYIRLESESKPATHGFIEALFNRRQSPLLQGIIESSGKAMNGYYQSSIIIENQSLIPAKKVNIHINFYGCGDLKSEVEEINSIIEIGDYYSNHFQLKYKYSNTVVKGVFLRFDFLLKPITNNYLIVIGYWSNNAPLKRHLIIGDIKENTLEVKDHRDEELFIQDHLDEHKIFYKVLKA